MDYDADYLLLRELVFAEQGRVCAAAADADSGGVCGGGRAGVFLEDTGKGPGDEEGDVGSGEWGEVVEVLGEGKVMEL